MAEATHIQIDNPQFLKKTPDTFDCFILLGKNYLSYLLMNQAHDLVYSIRHKSYENQVIAKHDFDEILADRMVKKASNIYLAIDAQKNTLVPASLYNSKEKEQYIQHLFDIASEEELFEMKVDDNMISLFCLKKDSVQFLKNRLRNVTFFESSASLLTTYPKYVHTQDSHSIFMSIKEDLATMSIFEGTSLILHNTHSYQTKEELLYHIANSIDKLKLNALTSGINLHGECEVTTELYELLVGHYHRVRYCSRLKEFGYPEELFNYPSHYFFNLFSLALCVS